MRVRKKPVVVEAVEWFKMGDHPAVVYSGKDDAGNEHYNIKTLKGWMCVQPGDWIITGIKGEHYPCKPDIFAATYEVIA